MRLRNKTALVTGSSSGIGAGVAVAFAQEGATVVINYPEESDASIAKTVLKAIETSKGKASTFQADVSKEDEVEALVKHTLDECGQIDILVNNAGIAHTAPVETIPVETWDRLLAVHLRGTFLMTRRVLPHMYERNTGTIINTSSQLAYKGSPGLTHYTAAKGAIISFTRSLALEIGDRNINANCVAPGATITPMLDAVPEEHIETIRQSIPKGRLAEVDDIIGTYVFLASDDASHYVGQVLSPNGGDVFL